MSQPSPTKIRPFSDNGKYTHKKSLGMTSSSHPALHQDQAAALTGDMFPLKDDRDLDSFKSFEEFYDWFKDELLYFGGIALDEPVSVLTRARLERILDAARCSSAARAGPRYRGSVSSKRGY